MQVNYGLGEKVQHPLMSEYVDFIHGVERIVIIRETWFLHNDCLEVVPKSCFIERHTKTVRDYVYSHYPFIREEHWGKFETYLRDEITNHIGYLIILRRTAPDISPPSHGTGSGTSDDLKKLEEKSQNIQSMSKIDRIVLLLALTFHKMGRNIFDSFSMSDLYMVAGVFVVWAGSHFWGVGELIDTALVTWLWWEIGWDCWHFLVIIINSVNIAVEATSVQQIDDASRELAPAAVALGLDALMGFIVHRFGSGSAVEKAVTKEVKAEQDFVKHDFRKDAKAVLPKEITTADLLKQSTATKEELTRHLEYLKKEGWMNQDGVDNFIAKGIWPEGINIPKSSSVLNPDGSINWPSHNGFVLDSNGMPILNDVSLSKGSIVDRYGGIGGRFTSPLQENGSSYSFTQRAMANIEDLRTYHQYKVLQDLTVQQGEIAPAFGDAGGGLQNVLPSSVKDLINQGIIKEIPVK